MADQSLILKGVALDFVFKLWKSDGTILPNPGGLAARISTSGSTGGAASTNAPTCLDTTGGGCRLQLTTSEMDNDWVLVSVTSTDSGAVAGAWALFPAAGALATASAVAALHDFDPASDTVARVTLADTTTDLTNAPTVDLTDVLTAIAALPDDTDIAALDALLDAIKLKTDAIGSLAVTVTSPVADSGAITLYQGDDYSAAHGRDLSFTKADAGHALGLDTATVRLKTGQTTWTASSVVETEAGYTMTFEPTAAQTRALTVRRQGYELEAVLADGDVVTLAAGTLAIMKDIPAVT